MDRQQRQRNSSSRKQVTQEKPQEAKTSAPEKINKYAIDPELLQLDYFRQDIKSEDYITRLTQCIIREEPTKKMIKNTDPKGQDTKNQMQNQISLLLEAFQWINEDLVQKRHITINSYVQLQKQEQAKMQDFQEVCKMVEEYHSDSKLQYRDLEKVANELTSIATRIGSKIQKADAQKQESMKMIDVLRSLYAFSIASPPSVSGGKWTILPDVFQEESQEAAKLACKLQGVANDALTSSGRSAGMVAVKIDNHMQATGQSDVQGKGTLEEAVRNLSAYCLDLEQRTVTGFDQAVAKKDINQLSQCALVMQELGSEMILINRFISQRPEFAQAQIKQLSQINQDDSGSLDKLLVILKQQIQEIIQDTDRTIPTICKIFPSKEKAVDIYVQRTFEEKVQVVLSKIINISRGQTALQGLRNALNSLVETHKSIRRLEDTLKKRSDVVLDLREVMDDLYSDIISSFILLEDKYLILKNEDLDQSIKGALDIGLINDVIEVNEACNVRCIQILQLPKVQSQRISYYFLEATSRVNYSLLGQVTRHLFAGVDQSMKDCDNASLMFLRITSLSNIIGKSGTQAAQQQGVGNFVGLNMIEDPAQIVEQTVAKVVQVSSTATLILQALISHYRKNVQGRLLNDTLEKSNCEAGLKQAIKLVTERVQLYLSNAVKQICSIIERSLVNKQQLQDFRPGDGQVDDLHTQTPACQFAIQLIKSTRLCADRNLQDKNRQAFLLDFGNRLYIVLQLHMQRYQYNELGALRWKNDIQEYTQQFREFNLPALNENFQKLKEASNILLLPPASIVELTYQLRMTQKEVLQYLKLRDDFKTAKVGDKTLEQLFNQQHGIM